MVLLAVRIISSTYNSKYAMEVPRCKIKSEESHLETTKPMERRYVVNR